MSEAIVTDQPTGDYRPGAGDDVIAGISIYIRNGLCVRQPDSYHFDGHRFESYGGLAGDSLTLLYLCHRARRGDESAKAVLALGAGANGAVIVDADGKRYWPMEAL